MSVLIWGGLVHPRRRGERAWAEEFARIDAGSSPQVRGTVMGASPAVFRARFIPAGAGNGSRPGCAAWTGAVQIGAGGATSASDAR